MQSVNDCEISHSLPGNSLAVCISFSDLKLPESQTLGKRAGDTGGAWTPYM